MSDTKNCNNCASKCKKDSPCSFYQKRVRSNLEKLMDELTMHYDTSDGIFHVGEEEAVSQAEEAEIGDRNREHEEEVEAIWREQMEQMSREQLEAIGDGGGNDGEE